MYIVYILKSKTYNHYYTGQTENIERRLLEHNSGNIYWTSRYKPWELIYTEKYNTRNDAIKREKYLKSHAGRIWIKNIISRLGGTSQNKK